LTSGNHIFNSNNVIIDIKYDISTSKKIEWQPMVTFH